MQVTPTSVSVRGGDNETTVIENPTVLMGDFGMWVKQGTKEDMSLEMYPWEKVLKISWNGEESIQKVWEEAVLTIFEDLLEDLEDLEEDFEEEAPVEPTKPTPTEVNADDPNKNPYE